ncbi:MAG TPA: hypothetical protein VFE78_24525 [Gemmataceae bacterium]|jgi:flavin reductase (DIM6/NTAB) family NADH-FMN oxidoreductase RutF|nr:hypothetical protein [Gemmataceae bacterium]
MAEAYFCEPRLGHGVPHDPFKAIVAPRPIGWISTVDPGGRVNLAPYSFDNAFCEAPLIVGFSSGGRKDSQQNAAAGGAFLGRRPSPQAARRAGRPGVTGRSAPSPHP